jgi:hypothetical protein
VISQVFGHLLNQVTKIFAILAKNFFLYKTQPHCVGLMRRVDLLSIGLGLKTAILAETSDQKTGRPGHNF